MMQIEINEQTVDRQLVDAGMKSDYEEQAVRLLLFHLFCAIRYYRDMTYAEKVKAGFLYRKRFKNDYSLTGFLKERKRKREKKNSPLHPSYKETETEVKEKDEKTSQCVGQEFRDLTERQMAFWLELEQYVGKYDRQTVLRFFYYWAEEDKRTGMMKYETLPSWNTRYRLAIWSKRSYEVDDQAAELRLAKAKGKQQAANTADQQAIAAKRDEDNARLEREIAERKQGAVSYEEWLKIKEV